VIFEAPHRIELLALALAEEAPARRVTLCRELTKQFETVISLPAAELPPWLQADANRLRGEFVVVLHASPQPPDRDVEAERTLRVLLAALPLKQAVALAAELTGGARNALYALALSWRDGDS
jgi:16S rRNA (cytidine1402-2'-O)-methyltransferase